VSYIVGRLHFEIEQGNRKDFTSEEVLRLLITIGSHFKETKVIEHNCDVDDSH
jgi:hypothetical protein